MSKAKKERDRALKKVLKSAGKAWTADGVQRIRLLPKGLYIGEQIRLMLGRQGFPKPHHHNAWGGLIRTAVRQGVLEDTYAMAHMQEPKSHARRSPVYRKWG